MSGAGEKTDTEKPRKDRGGDRRDVARSPGTPGAPGAGRGREDPPPGAQEGAWPWGTSMCDFWPQSRDGVNLGCSKPLLLTLGTDAPGPHVKGWSHVPPRPPGLEPPRRRAAGSRRKSPNGCSDVTQGCPVQFRDPWTHASWRPEARGSAPSGHGRSRGLKAACSSFETNSLSGHWWKC